MARSTGLVLDKAGASLKVESFGRGLSVGVDKLRANEWNPNVQDPETFRKELASIRRFGFVQPIIVRPSDGGMYEIIDGEHRWKAAQELGMTEVPIFDVGRISDHEAMQLTVILNELRGKPEEKKLGEILKNLLASDTLDRLTEVMPFTKEQYGKIAKLPEFDWDKLQKSNQERAERRWVERIFRLPKEVAEVLDEAIQKAKADRDDIDDAQALETIANTFIGVR